MNHFHKTYNFMRWDSLAFNLSIILVIVSTILIVTRGFHWGLDFTGGMMIELNSEKAINLNSVRDALENAGFTNAVVQHFGSSRDMIMRIPLVSHKIDQELVDKVLEISKQIIDSKNVSVKRMEFVGPNVSNDFMQTGILALLFALICILIYIGFRFQWKLAVGVVLSLVHDVIITLGALSLFCIEIDLTILSSLMSVITYSLNDSIVIFDRIRENFSKICHDDVYEIFNVSLTQTLNRTIITSTSALIVALVLLIFGGETLHGFSITLLIGIPIGSISSIYVASALALKLGIKQENLIPKIEKRDISKLSVP